MVVSLSQSDINDLKKQGYSDEEIKKAIEDVEKEDLDQSAGQTRQQTPQRASSFSSKPFDDIARYQLELNDLLEQTEHILKGDVLVLENGKKTWKDNPHPEENPLNEEGIRKIMLELQNYINRHIILGDYEDDDIRIIMKNYGKKLTDLIFMKYEEMGMNTESKRQEYRNIVENIVNLVYGSYSRAKDGGERRSLREMITISQQHSSQGFNPNQQGYPQQPKARGLLNPMRYIQGKYV